MTPPRLRLRGITRRFPGIVALDDVSFDVAAGSCHAICGENGAGKSTLGKVLAGLHTANAGTIELDGASVHFSSPRAALDAGVAMVHQELAFCDNLTVADNLCLRALPARRGLIDPAALLARARELLAVTGSPLDPSRSMATLSVAEQQLVQVAAAVAEGAKVVVFDEPTSALGEAEVQQLHALVRMLRAQGVTILYVSHRLPEIFALCDTITVLRDGRHVTTQPTASFDELSLVRAMIGRDLASYLHASFTASIGRERLRVESLSCAGRVHDVSLTVHAGEIVGLAGLVGAGRSEIARAIFGLDHSVRGEVFVDGTPARIRSPRDAIARGLGFVPEDRKQLGLVLSMRARENATLPVVQRFARGGLVDRNRESMEVGQAFSRVALRASGAEAGVSSLSGGNQQKVVLARWLTAGSEILLLDEPTRGVDVGAKAELHAWIGHRASAGAAVLLISSELPELLALSTRILVLRDGRLAGEVSRAEATQELLLRLMAGVAAPAGAD